MPPPPVSRSLPVDNAVRLLRTALEPAAQVVPRKGKGDRIRLRVTTKDLGPIDLTLRHGLPPPVHVEGDAHRSVLWIVRADAATRDRLRQRDLNFIDLTSRTVRLHLPNLFLDRGGIPARLRLGSSASAKERSPYSDRGSLVTRALLAQGRHQWTFGELATAAGVSKALASRVVAFLDRARLLRTEREGRALRITLDNPWPLFLQWTNHYRWTDNHSLSVAAPVGDPERFLARLKSALTAQSRQRIWALTMQAGASVVARHATWDTVHAYVECRNRRELDELARDLGWRSSPQGRLVLLAPRYRRAVWWKLQPGSLPVVHPIQLMLDLWHYPLRGREEAEQLARVLRWPRPAE